MKNIKVFLLSSASSIHTIQWAINLKSQGLCVTVVSQHPKSESFPDDIPVHILPYLGFIGYFLNAIFLKKIIKKDQPDLINVHYASGYATTARLANCHPYVLSIWGSDVYEFPFRSFIHKYLLKKNLAAADTLASTSLAMAKQTEQFLTKQKAIAITPFGVDLSKFFHNKINKTNQEIITIGTVKSLRHVYGIDVLISALAKVYFILKEQNSEFSEKINFRIIGGGPDLIKLQQLSRKLGVEHVTDFVGKVDHDAVPDELGKLDIYVALSRQESFGVAVLEAQAMGVPVVVSNVGGLPEVVIHGETGFIVEAENSDQAASAILKLVLDHELRNKFSMNAEDFVHNSFSWNHCAEKMQKVYQETLVNFKKGNGA